MKPVTAVVAAVAAAAVAAACAVAPTSPRTGGTPSSLSATASPPVPRPTVPPGATVIYGAGTYLLSAKQGALMVHVRRVVAPTGKASTRVSYERTSACADDGAGFVNCPVLWEKDYAVPNASFSIDPLLRTAEFRDTLQGKALRITWESFGRPRVQLNENGNVFSEKWDALGEGTWGNWHHKDPSDASPPSLLSRRVPAR